LPPAVTLVIAVAAAVAKKRAIRGALELITVRSGEGTSSAVTVRPASGGSAERTL